MYLSITSTSHCSWGKSGSWQVPDVAPAPLETHFLIRFGCKDLVGKIGLLILENKVHSCGQLYILADGLEWLFLVLEEHQHQLWQFWFFVCLFRLFLLFRKERGKEETILRLTNEPLVWSLESHVFVESLNQMPSWLRNRKLVEQADEILLGWKSKRSPKSG